MLERRMPFKSFLRSVPFVSSKKSRTFTPSGGKIHVKT
jgi:hypothetical protein